VRIFSPCRHCGTATQQYLEYEVNQWQLHCLQCSETQPLSKEEVAKLPELNYRQYEEVGSSSPNLIEGQMNIRSTKSYKEF
jgi:hypothetical protein